MKRQLWSDDEIITEVERIWWDFDFTTGSSEATDLAIQVRDDLTRRLMQTQRAAWRLLRANDELRRRVQALEAENVKLVACAKDDGEMLRMMNEAIAELENIETDLKAQLAAASQAEREWRDAEKELPDKWRDVEVRHIGWLRDNSSWAVLEQGYPTAWRPLPAQGEGSE